MDQDKHQTAMSGMIDLTAYHLKEISTLTAENDRLREWIGKLAGALEAVRQIHDQKLSTADIDIGEGTVSGYPDSLADHGEFLAEIAEVCEAILSTLPPELRPAGKIEENNP